MPNFGLDILLEKPFCIELEQGRELMKLAEEKQRILMIAHCVRFAPEWEFLADCIKDKRYGELKLLATARMGGEPTWGVWQDPEIKKTCGGSLLDMLIHDIDFVYSCLGTPSEMKINLKCDEYWELGFNYDQNQKKISIKGGFLYKFTPFTSEYLATFDNASIRFSSLNPKTINIGTANGLESVSVDGDLYYNEMEYFADCIESRKKPERCLPEDKGPNGRIRHVSKGLVFEMPPLRAVGSNHVVGTDFNPSAIPPHNLRAVGSNHINPYMFRSYGTPNFNCHHSPD